MKKVQKEHKQIKIEVSKGHFIKVDEGLQDIIGNLFHWDIPTDNSCICINDNKTWISFASFYVFDKFLHFSLRNDIIINGNCAQRETLFDFLQEESEIKLCFGELCLTDPNNEDTVIGTSELYITISLRFPHKYIERFRKLFFEVFPSK